MIDKVLVANRGEIAVRVIRACRELGIGTVAVYSSADRSALHVRLADEAYLLGPPPARDSYLRGDKIIEIAKRSGAQAIHPGYGFLAENEGFAHAVEGAGLIFIGPRSSAIAAMGDKLEARSTVTAAGVPVVPGTEGKGNLQDGELIAVAPEIGFPLLIKATAGGGGRGMREVRTPEEMPDLLQSARREAEAAFGDGNVYLEKLLLDARHIEFQILADSHGNVIHLGERECSLQRRHQKLLEESPSPFIDEELRSRMGTLACTAAQAVDYLNAGTIEFLVDKDRNYYFLEMNTRLQVEHPVTEFVTGVDIVKEQIRIAMGERLSLTQDDIHLKGWAIECRINAEDPAHNFVPSTGKLDQIILPTGPGIRVDTGVYPGFEISPYYDSLISKLICWGETRQEAIVRMRHALEEYRVVGVKTNIPFHQCIMDSPQFQAGDFDTRFIEEQFSLEESQNGKHKLPDIAAILAVLVTHREGQRAAQIVRRGDRDTSNWKRMGRWERMNH
ncbi:MAG TPA: acetyl-CoA carboxylase biotin carboxylase subunit [Anaerolineae bacterium]|nr:acetyl-CoA carboxylase biotin carboxylase subunit [Anaerolineae bacterium]